MPPREWPIFNKYEGEEGWQAVKDAHGRFKRANEKAKDLAEGGDADGAQAKLAVAAQLLADNEPLVAVMKASYDQRMGAARRNCKEKFANIRMAPFYLKFKALAGQSLRDQSHAWLGGLERP